MIINMLQGNVNATTGMAPEPIMSNPATLQDEKHSDC